MGGLWEGEEEIEEEEEEEEVEAYVVSIKNSRDLRWAGF